MVKISYEWLALSFAIGAALGYWIGRADWKLAQLFKKPRQ